MASLSVKPAVSVYIGRFQIFHDGQLALLRRALGKAPRCIVVLGSSLQARSPKNPFTWQERAEMIRLALPEADRQRLQFLPIRDYYDQVRWVHAVRQGVTELAGPQDAESVVLVGHLKDGSSEYLRNFPGWDFDAAPSQGRIDGTALRDAYFGSGGVNMAAALAALVSKVPESTRDFLAAWSTLPEFTAMAAEWTSLQQEKSLWSASPYPPIFVTVDAVVRCRGHVLLIRRARAPGKGLYAVPGGFVEQRETLYQSALRELTEETHLNVLASNMHHALKAVQTFDHPDRSQRGRVITHAHFFDLDVQSLPEVFGGDDASAAAWMPIEALAAMEDGFHDDHFHMLDYFFSLTARPRNL